MTFANNHQSGSDYRIYNTGTIVRGAGESASIYPVALGDGSTFIQWNPIPLGSAGSNFRTYSAFANDSWRVNGRLTANLGLRWDKNHGEDQQGTLVAKDAAFSPRIGVVLDPLGDQKWSVTASFAQYVAALNNAIGDSTSGGGNPQTFRFAYRGPGINADPNRHSPDAGRDSTDLRLVLCQRCGQAPVHQSARCSGCDTTDSRQPEITQRAGIRSRHQSTVRQPCGGACGFRVQELPRLLHRADRHQHRHRHRRVRPGLRPDAGGEHERAEAPVQGGHHTGHVSNGTSTDIGATYTLSRTWGNFNGENVVSGPARAAC